MDTDLPKDIKFYPKVNISEWTLSLTSDLFSNCSNKVKIEEPSISVQLMSLNGGVDGMRAGTKAPNCAI